MRQLTVLCLSILGAAACNTTDPGFSGYQMERFFPFDGEIIGWTFGSRSAEVEFELDRTFDPALSEIVDGTTHHTYTTSRRCIGDVEECGQGFAWEYVMSAGGSGVFLHAYEYGDEGRVELDPPIALASGRMAGGDIVTSQETDGHTWVSTFDTNEDCDQTLDVDWDCGKFTLESDPPGHWLAGEWYAVSGYNIVSFKRTLDEARWRLNALPQRASD